MKTSQLLMDAIVLILFGEDEHSSITIAQKISVLFPKLSLAKAKDVCYVATARLRRDGFIEEVKSSERQKPFRLTDAGKDEVDEILSVLRRIS